MHRPAPGFRAKIVNSVQLSGLRFVSDIGLRLVSTVVLTRLLAPEVYGIFAVVMLYLFLLEMISDLSIRTLIVTREGEVTPAFLQSCWTVAIGRGVVIALLSGLIALAIGGLQSAGAFAADSPYAAATLPWAILSLGLATFLVGFQSPAQFLYERDMRFGRVTAVYVGINIVNLCVTIALAVYFRSVWALVLGQFARNILQVAMSFAVFQGPAMRLRFDRAHLAIVWDRGKWIIGNSTLMALSQSADRLLLGFVMSASLFGYYFIARQLVDMVARFLVTIDEQMGLQVFTHLQKSAAAEFRRNYYRYRTFFDAIAGLSTGGLLVLTPLLVDVIFDDRYQGIAPIAQILIMGLLLTGPLLLRSAYYAERRFRVPTYLGLLSTAVLWLGLSVAVLWFGSITAGLVVVALHRLPEALAYLAAGRRRGWVSLRQEARLGLFCLAGAGLGWIVLTLWERLV